MGLGLPLYLPRSELRSATGAHRKEPLFTYPAQEERQKSNLNRNGFQRVGKKWRGLRGGNFLPTR